MLSIQLNYMHEHGPFLFIKLGGTLVQRIAQLTVEQRKWWAPQKAEKCWCLCKDHKNLLITLLQFNSDYKCILKIVSKLEHSLNRQMRVMKFYLASITLSWSSLPHSQSSPGSTAKCKGSILWSESVRGITTVEVFTKQKVTNGQYHSEFHYFPTYL